MVFVAACYFVESIVRILLTKLLFKTFTCHISTLGEKPWKNPRSLDECDWTNKYNVNGHVSLETNPFTRSERRNVSFLIQCLIILTWCLIQWWKLHTLWQVRGQSVFHYQLGDTTWSGCQCYYHIQCDRWSGMWLMENHDACTLPTFYSDKELKFFSQLVKQI